MARLLDDREIRFVPHGTEPHHSVTIGANLYSPYIPNSAKSILVQASAKDIRYTLDGLVPTGAVGFVLVAGNDPILIELTEKMHIQFFGTDATSMLNYCIGI